MIRAAAAVAAVAVLAWSPSLAHADSTGIAEAALYGGVSVAAAFTTIGNGVGLVYDEPVAPGWRLAGAITGSAGILLGSALIVERHGTTTSVTIGAIPLALGVSSCLTAFFVDEEGATPTLVPITDSRGALSGAGFALTF